jgi:pimeloyl-ACP methyl ester carboxylesterase
MSIHHAIRLKSADGLTLAATLRGDAGLPVMLLHGGGQTRHSWKETGVDLAAAGFRSIAIDQRGHGESAWDPGKRYSFMDYAADISAVARQLKERFGVWPAAVGASLGGLSSLLSTGDGVPFPMLVLVDVTPRLDPKGVDSIQGFMRERVSDGFATVEEAADAIAAYLPHRPRPRSLDGLRKNLRKRADGRLVWHWDPAFLDGPRPIAHDSELVQERALAATRGLAMPALLVRGKASELVRREYAEEFLAMAPHAEFADIANARHMVAGDSNKAFSGAVLSFLDRHLAG